MNLELNHLSAYLPYQLNCQLYWKSDGKFEFEREGLLIGIKTTFKDENPIRFLVKNKHESKYHSELAYNYDEIKPILRPLSTFQNQITHNENTFIPSLNLKLSYSGEVIGLNPATWSHRVVQKMFEWHFDVFGLIDKGLAVPYSKNLR